MEYARIGPVRTRNFDLNIIRGSITNELGRYKVFHKTRA